MFYFVPCEGSQRKESKLTVHIQTSPLLSPSPLNNPEEKKKIYRLTVLLGSWPSIHSLRAEQTREKLRTLLHHSVSSLPSSARSNPSNVHPSAFSTRICTLRIASSVQVMPSYRSCFLATHPDPDIDAFRRTQDCSSAIAPEDFGRNA